MTCSDNKNSIAKPVLTTTSEQRPPIYNSQASVNIESPTIESQRWSLYTGLTVFFYTLDECFSNRVLRHTCVLQKFKLEDDLCDPLMAIWNLINQGHFDYINQMTTFAVITLSKVG
jgi:hypothetical protein